MLYKKHPKKHRVPVPRSEIKKFRKDPEKYFRVDANLHGHLKDFSGRLRFLRAARDVSTAEAAKGIGVSRTTYELYERGPKEEREFRRPSYDTILLIAQYFKVTTDYLFGLRGITYDDLLADERVAHVLRRMLTWTTEQKECALDILHYLEDLYARRNAASKRAFLESDEDEDENESAAEDILA